FALLIGAEVMPKVYSSTGFPPCISLSIEFNQHASCYQTVEQWLKEEEERSPDGRPGFDWVSPEERQRAIDTDQVWMCHWYPRTPVGSCSLAASTFEALMAAVNEP
ncbi:MAG: hypothetical protein M3451_12235, partial [Chloroflexota bacterium]|nr:hypothetical protein [Chloroflexota bacterium]